MSSNSPLSAIEQEQITSQGEGMGFELENPEVAEIVSQYRDGKIAYGDAKFLCLKELVRSNNLSGEEAIRKTRELLLGETNEAGG